LIIVSPFQSLGLAPARRSNWMTAYEVNELLC
jgi:hypothetical protein